MENSMKTLTTLCYQKLKDHHIKMTQCRKAMVETLGAFEHPFTASELLHAIGNHSAIHKATVYRDLSCFINAGIIKELSLVGIGAKYYEVSLREHHHHFVCEACHTILDIDTAEAETALTQVEQRLEQKGLHIREHNLKFYGLCPGCSQRRNVCNT
jgi:Fe2+ or Zn2+ uptake regulation protein